MCMLSKAIYRLIHIKIKQALFAEIFILTRKIIMSTNFGRDYKERKKMLY